MYRSKILYFLILFGTTDCDIEVQNNKENSENIDEIDTKMYQNQSLKQKLEGKVIGGAFAKIENFPHAAFFYPRCKGESWICGSSILNQVMVITAAHCIKFCNNKIDTAILVGAAEIAKCQQARSVKHIVSHPDYREEQVHSDIALALFMKKLVFSPYVKRIAIQPTFPRFKNSEAQVAGWGSINEAGESLKKLKFVSQVVWDNAACARHFEGVVKGTFCASQGRGSYPYKGDSGSGLVVPDGSYVLIGVVAFRGARKRDLVVYTNVTYYYQWIVQKAHFLYCTYYVNNTEPTNQKKKLIIMNKLATNNVSNSMFEYPSTRSVSEFLIPRRV